MESRDYFNSLFDLYKELLTEIERETFMNYYQEDYSLSEIALDRKISKSSVGKTLKVVEDKLAFYESKLKLYEKNQNLKELLKENDILKIKEKLQAVLEN